MNALTRRTSAQSRPLLREILRHVLPGYILLGGALLLPVAGAQEATPQERSDPVSITQPSASTATSPAQLVFNRVNRLLRQEYGGLSTVDRVALGAEFQQRLDAVCAALPACPESKAYPVIEAELTALGDEHSFFQTPEDFKEFVASATGGNRKQFGVKLAKLDGENRVVTEVVPGSAAQEAGLQRGDLLLSLNGRPYTYAALRSARESGENITLGLTRRGEGLIVSMSSRESSTRDLPRLTYVKASEQSASGADVAVLRIPTFLSGGGVAQTVHDLVGQAQDHGAVGMIVDLRGNTGGSLSECDNAASAFLPSMARIARSAGGNSRTVISRGTRLEDGRMAGAVRNPNLWTGPVAVLVDEGSASCSEFFAFEMQYAQRGPVIGEATAGVGNTATRVFEVGEGALQLTILNYAKPEGTPYPVQVMPDKTLSQGEDEIRLLTKGVDVLLNEGLKALLGAPVLTLDPFRQQP